MSTVIEFGEGADHSPGPDRVTIHQMPSPADPASETVISLIASNGHIITGTPQDMRRLAFVLIGMTGGMKGGEE